MYCVVLYCIVFHDHSTTEIYITYVLFIGVCRICEGGRGPTFLGVWASCMLCSHEHARGVRGHSPAREKILNSAIWCVLEHIFIIFYLKTILIILLFYTTIMINCSHVLARVFSSMIHG